MNKAQREQNALDTYPTDGELAAESAYEVTNGYSDNAIALWGADDVDELASFMPDSLDLTTVPTIEQRQKEAKVAIQKRANDLIGHDIVWVAWRPQEALLVAEGTITEGFFAVGRDLTTNENISMFIGGSALVKMLKRVSAPMRARLEKRGRTLVFANP